MVNCKICGIDFENKKIYANHIRWKHTEDSSLKAKNRSLGTMKSNDNRFGIWVESETVCSNINCNNSINIKYRSKKGPKSKYFCSISCANSRGPRNEEFYNKTSIKMKEAWKNGRFDHINYSENKRFSSKKERLIVDHFKNKYPEDQWKSGSRLKIDENLYTSRDMYSDKLKICFEFDGIWHFKNIKNQLEKKMLVDRKLEEWCLNNEYRLIRVEDGFEDISLIENLIYRSTEQIIKIGKSYKL